MSTCWALTSCRPAGCPSLCRLAQAVLSREDPHETFLKRVPSSGAVRLDISYPVITKECPAARLRSHTPTRLYFYVLLRVACW